MERRVFPSFTQQLSALENGELTEPEAIAFYQEAVDTGIIYSLQGSHQRTAQELIDRGVVRHDPSVTRTER